MLCSIAEISENVYLALNQPIWLEKKKIEILVHLTFNLTQVGAVISWHWLYTSTGVVTRKSIDLHYTYVACLTLCC